MKLRDYIEEVGIEQFAKKFKLKPRTVYSWFLQDRRPRPEIARVIVQKTPVTMDGIYGA